MQNNRHEFQTREDLEAFLGEKLRSIDFHALAFTNLSEAVDSCGTISTELDDPIRSVALIGNIGSSFWPHFAKSLEYRDGLSDPLDRYSKRLLNSITVEIEGARAVFPSDGPAYLPFQSWALKSGIYHQSPVGVLIHQEFGLWTAFRGAIVLPYELKNRKEVSKVGVSPCLSCEEKPCLTSCPVAAFKASATGLGFGSYDVESCRDLVAQKADCFQSGCLARRACPLNHTLCYKDEQVSFHMNKFISLRTSR